MALFKSIQHTLQSEKGHVALLLASHPPASPFTTLFDFCDFKAEPLKLIRAPRARLGLGVGDLKQRGSMQDASAWVIHKRKPQAYAQGWGWGDLEIPKGRQGHQGTGR